MLKYILKRLVSSIITIWVVITATFFLMHAVPGGPFDGGKVLPPAIKANLEAKFGLDKSLGQQYAMYLKDLIHGDLGPSMMYEGRTVNDMIAYSFPASAKLGFTAVGISVIFGLIMGIIAALKQGKWQDNLCMIISTIGVTIPSFVMATIFIYFFAVKLGWFPAVGFDGPQYMVLPALALSGYSTAFISRLVRSSLLEVVRQDYIRVAKAKGLSKGKVVVKHALRNSLIPLVTYLGPLLASVLSGSFIIESLFGVPGLGKEFVQSIGNRDYSTTLGVTIFFCTLLIVANFIVDILYVVIDPRIKLEN